jgi:hypothetical protein
MRDRTVAIRRGGDESPPGTRRREPSSRSQWVLSRLGASSGVVDARTVAQLEENLAELELSLTDEDLADSIALIPPTLGLRQEEPRSNCRAIVAAFVA